jgi:hypothetical protein
VAQYLTLGAIAPGTYFVLENTDWTHTNEPLVFSLTTVAAAGSVGSQELGPPQQVYNGSAFTTYPTYFNSYDVGVPLAASSAVSVVAATAGHAFLCYYWTP